MQTYPDDEDGQVLLGLTARGVDLSVPRSIEFALAAPNEDAAHRIASAVETAGYEVDIYYDEGEPDDDGVIDPADEEFGPSWTVYAMVQMVPEYDRLISIQSELDVLVAPLGGVMDGWGTTVDPTETNG